MTVTAVCLDISEETVKVRLHRVWPLLHNDMYAQTESVTTAAFQGFGSRFDRIVSAVLARFSSPGQDLQA